MPTSRKVKEAIVAELAREVETCEGVIVLAYKGMKFSELTKVRTFAKEQGSDFRVIKNALLRVVLKARNIELDEASYALPTAVVVVQKDFVSVAKEIKKYTKEIQAFDVKSGWFDGQVLSAKDVLVIADLPSRDELLAQVLRTLNNPASNLVSLLSNIPRSFLYALNAIKEKKA